MPELTPLVVKAKKKKNCRLRFQTMIAIMLFFIISYQCKFSFFVQFFQGRYDERKFRGKIWIFFSKIDEREGETSGG
jgi:hypothetical protein